MNENLAKALNEFQSEIVTVGKGAENPFFKSKYADLGSIMKKSQPVLTKHGLSVVQLPSNIEGKPALTTIVMHLSGEHIEATTPLLIEKQTAQGFGSAMTYTRRYAYASALQIVIDDDDDGNGAQNGSQEPDYNQYNRLVKKDQIAKLLETAKTQSGLATREEVLDWFKEVIGKDIIHVKQTEYDEVIRAVEGYVI